MPTQPAAVLSTVYLVLISQVLGSQVHAQQTVAAAAPSDDAPVDPDILFYIADEDANQQVAIDYSDALAYARSSLEPCDEDEVPTVQVTTFMTGDLYDNELTDVSKLNVRVVEGRHQIVVVDKDDYDDIKPEPDHDELMPITNPLQVQAMPRQTPGLSWGEWVPKRELDLDEWLVAEVDGQTVASLDNVPVPAQKVPSSEIVVDLDEAGVFVAGSRKVKTDLDDIPMFYTNDRSSAMVGDLFDNQRTDQILLRRVVQLPEPPLSQSEELLQNNPDIIEVTIVDGEVTETAKLDDLDEVDVLYEPDDFDVIPERRGGDLPLMEAYNSSDVMVGDLFDNQRSDEQRLTQVVLMGNNVRLTWEETAEPKTKPIPPPKVKEIDIDEVEQILVTPQTVDFDEEIFILKTITDHDEDDLDYDSPLAYMTGDLFDNKRTDSSRLTIWNNQGKPPTWAVTEQDDFTTVYDLNPPEEECEKDDLSAESPPNSTLNQLTNTRDRRIPSSTLASYDLDDVPTFISSDSLTYLAGDLFDNDRSDTFKLTIIVNRDIPPIDWDETGRSPNPGFLQ